MKDALWECHPQSQLFKEKKGMMMDKEMMNKKMKKVMGEYKMGDLHSGSKDGPMVKNRSQAIAIGLSEARKATSKRKVK